MEKKSSSRPSASRLWCALLLATVLSQQTLQSQDRTFSVVGSAGYGFLNLSSVDADNSSDVEGWARLGIPIGGFASVKQSPHFSGRITYRYSRDFAVSLCGSNFSKTVTSSYSGPDAVLQLDRGVGATDLSLGIAYYPALQPYFLQWYVQVNLGVLMAAATAKAVGTQATKPAGVIIMVPLIDSEGTYKKTKTSASFLLGADMPLVRHLFLKGEAGYRVAQMGELDGDITRFGIQSSETSTTIFDYSGVLINFGIGFEF